MTTRPERCQTLHPELNKYKSVIVLVCMVMLLFLAHREYTNNSHHVKAAKVAAAACNGATAAADHATAAALSANASANLAAATAATAERLIEGAIIRRKHD